MARWRWGGGDSGGGGSCDEGDTCGRRGENHICLIIYLFYR